MVWFKKNNKIVDLGERYKKQQERATRIKEDAMESNAESSENVSATPFSFFDNPASNSDLNSGVSEDSNEKKRRLAKRLSDMTAKLEDLSNQIYHLQQRLEVVERKTDINKF